MHAVSYADQMLLLEQFTQLLSEDPISDEALVKDIETWSDAVNADLTHATSFHRQISELLVFFNGASTGETGKLARSGLLYLLRSGGPAPQALTPITMQAHSFVLSIFIHKCRKAVGRASAYIPPELGNEERRRAEEIFSSALESPLYSDSELIRKTRAFVEDPGLPTSSLFFRRLLRSAEFLATVLEGGVYAENEEQYARAALSYLVLEEDSIDDRLGLIGFLDDAYILDLAVSFIEPARKPWIRLIEASSEMGAIFSQATVDSEGADPVPVQADMLVDAAVLSEPMVSLEGPLGSALFVPAAGSTPILLGVSVVLSMLKEAVGQDEEEVGLEQVAAWVERYATSNARQFVMVATPAYRSEALLKSVRFGGTSLWETLPIGVVNEQGAVTQVSREGAAPLLMVVPSLDVAGSFTDAAGHQLHMSLVDLEVASGGEIYIDDEVPLEEEEEEETEEESEEEQEDLAASAPVLPKKTKPSRPKRTGKENYDVLGTYMGETGFLKRLTREQEGELSIKMLGGREAARQALIELGTTAVGALYAVLKDGSEELVGELSRLSIHRKDGADNVDLDDQMQRVLLELSLEDSHYSSVIDSLKNDHRLSLQLKKHLGKSSKKDELDAFTKEHGLSPEVFADTYVRLVNAVKDVDDAVALLTRGNLRLVLWMAKKYRNRSTFFLDMVQEGNLGLMRAARKFDHRKGAGFGTYANWWVRQSIERYLSHHSRTIRIPVTALTALRRVRDAKRVIERKTGELATPAEISESTGMQISEVRRIMRVSHELEHGCVALDGPIDSESGTTFGEMLPDPEAIMPLDELSLRQLGEEARKLLETLEPLEAKVLRMRFGIGNDGRHTLEDIGNQVGLTRERIRQIEIKALGKLRFRAKRLGVRP